MKDEKLIIGLSNSLFGHEKTQQNTCATRFDSTIQVLRASGRRSGQVVWLRGRYIYGPAAPRIRARHCRAKVSGAARPATSALCRTTMHGAAQAFDRVRAIDAVKSVS